MLAAQRIYTGATDFSSLCMVVAAQRMCTAEAFLSLEFGIASIATAAQYHDVLSLTAVFSINGDMAAQRMCTAATWPEDTLLAVLRMCTADNHSSGYQSWLTRHAGNTENVHSGSEVEAMIGN